LPACPSCQAKRRPSHGGTATKGRGQSLLVPRARSVECREGRRRVPMPRTKLPGRREVQIARRLGRFPRPAAHASLCSACSEMADRNHQHAPTDRCPLHHHPHGTDITGSLPHTPGVLRGGTPERGAAGATPRGRSRSTAESKYRQAGLLVHVPQIPAVDDRSAVPLNVAVGKGEVPALAMTCGHVGR